MSMVLVVDDKEMLRDSVGSTLVRSGFTVVSASDGESALALIARRRPDAVITDLKMPGLSGIDLLDRIREIDDELPVVLMTAYGTIETAVQAIKLGAFDYLTKPFEGDALIIAIKRAIEHARVLRENAVLRASADRTWSGQATGSGGRDGVHGVDRLIGESPAMHRVKEQVIALAESQGTVLICGESGTGKEVVARVIHELSNRVDRPFLAVNCAALSESLLESELFGHEKGAFTGADRLRKGRFELADGGSLLLDEVSEVEPAIQAKLLRVLQERAFERVGSSLTLEIDVRVIATSNRDLPEAVAQSQFRRDLFFRLNVLPIHLPPLRDRIEDVPLLAEAFVGQIAEREGREPVTFDDEAMSVMCRYSWPGNVRELQNICERALVLGPVGRIPASLIEPWLGGIPHATLDPVQIVEAKPASHNGVYIPPGGRRLEEIEREAILGTLSRFNGHRLRTAKALGIGVRTLGLKLKKWKEMHLIDPGV